MVTLAAPVVSVVEPVVPEAEPEFVELLDVSEPFDELEPVEVLLEEPLAEVLVLCLVALLLGVGDDCDPDELEPGLVVSLPALVAELPEFDELIGAGAAKPPLETAVADWPRYQDAPSTPRVMTPIVDLVDCLTRQTPLRESIGLRYQFPSAS